LHRPPQSSADNEIEFAGPTRLKARLRPRQKTYWPDMRTILVTAYAQIVVGLRQLNPNNSFRSVHRTSLSWNLIEQNMYKCQVEMQQHRGSSRPFANLAPSCPDGSNLHYRSVAPLDRRS
jgi:hypothetical protein